MISMSKKTAVSTIAGLIITFSLFMMGLSENNEPAVTVGMTNQLDFTPDTVRITTGETVRWENTSLLAHSVTADPEEETKEESVSLPEGAKPFDSGLMDPETSFEYTFTVPGTYNYFCLPHEAMMTGVVIVEE